MLAHMRFKKNVLSSSLHQYLSCKYTPIYLSVLLGILTQPTWATDVSALKQSEQSGQTQALITPSIASASTKIQDVYDLPPMNVETVDQDMMRDILNIAESAKREAIVARQNQRTEQQIVDATQQEIALINQEPVKVDQLIQEIQVQQQINVAEDPLGATIDHNGIDHNNLTEPEQGFFKRILAKINPTKNGDQATWRIRATVQFENPVSPTVDSALYTKATANLKENIEAKLSSFTQESFNDFEAAVPQLRVLSNQAAQAVGFYNAKFRFERTGDSTVKVYVTPSQPVIVKDQKIEFKGKEIGRAHV